MTIDPNILHEVLIVPRHAFIPLADTQIIERPGWMQIITPSLPEGGLNEISFCSLTVDEIEPAIDAAIALYQGRCFRWTVGPDSAPTDLNRRLIARGLRGENGIGVARSTDLAGETSTDQGPNADADAFVTRVDEQSVDDFTAIMSAVWGVQAAPLDALHRRVLAVAPERLPMFVLRVKQRPVAAGAYFAFDRSAYLLGAGVLPEFRGRGLYRALVAARCSDAAKRGIKLATSHARATTSAPILHRMGFEVVCRLQNFSFS